MTHFYTSLPIVTDDVSLEQLNNAYRKETDADIKERILLVRRVRIDGYEASKIAERELHKSRWWAYKWLNRFDKGGLEGLKDQPRSGRPPLISEKKMLKIRQEISENPSGWQAKQIMDLIYKKTGIRYHEVHIYRLLHKWEFSPKVPQKRFVNADSKEEKEDFKKGYGKHSRKSQKDSQ
ncbi:MAG: helix-turn-helix domain-containing protein [Candidatus Nitrosocosmicus sp.]